MQRRNPLHIHGDTIKIALGPLKPYIVATIACAGAAWVLFNLSEKAATGSASKSHPGGGSPSARREAGERDGCIWGPRYRITDCRPRSLICQ